jgi:hypothetical protein
VRGAMLGLRRKLMEERTFYYDKPEANMELKVMSPQILPPLNMGIALLFLD